MNDFAKNSLTNEHQPVPNSALPKASADLELLKHASDLESLEKAREKLDVDFQLLEMLESGKQRAAEQGEGDGTGEERIIAPERSAGDGSRSVVDPARLGKIAAKMEESSHMSRAQLFWFFSFLPILGVLAFGVFLCVRSPGGACSCGGGDDLSADEVVVISQNMIKKMVVDYEATDGGDGGGAGRSLWKGGEEGTVRCTVPMQVYCVCICSMGLRIIFSNGGGGVNKLWPVACDQVNHSSQIITSTRDAHSLHP